MNITVRERNDSMKKLSKLFIGISTSSKRVRHQILECAANEISVLITGETGTGKEVVAEQIHKFSNRKNKEMVSISVPGLPTTVIESELFGHKKGAFSGADRDKVGLVKQADGSTLFLDEIGDMPQELQSKLLRPLEKKEFYPVGETHVEKSDFRVISATNQPSEKVRGDLYYRIAQTQIQIPSLKERREDILPLAEHILSRKGINIKSLHICWIDLHSLLMNPWRGNVRELGSLLQTSRVEKLRGAKILWMPDFQRVKFNSDKYELPPPTMLWGAAPVSLHTISKKIESKLSESSFRNNEELIMDVLVQEAGKILRHPRYSHAKEEYEKRILESKDKQKSGDKRQILIGKDAAAIKLDMAIKTLVQQKIKLPELRDTYIKEFLRTNPVTNRIGERLHSIATKVGVDSKTLKKYL